MLHPDEMAAYLKQIEEIGMRFIINMDPTDYLQTFNFKGIYHDTQKT